MEGGHQEVVVAGGSEPAVGGTCFRESGPCQPSSCLASEPPTSMGIFRYASVVLARSGHFQRGGCKCAVSSW